MRNVVASFGLLLSVVAVTPAVAAGCAGRPEALGTSRTLVVDPAQHVLLGGFQYRESLPLNDKEVVITFDDGPLPPYSTRILDILAQECVKATFFMVGRMARSFPRIVRRVYDEGHTLANHSQSHPFNFHTMALPDAVREVDSGFESIAAAVGDPAKVAPFFRFPGLHRQDAVERYLASKRVMSWSVDFMADDWTRINAREVVRRALSRLEAKGKGILLLHDIQPATALALPELLHELKVRGYRVVHVVPATAERPATATTAEQWRVRNPPSSTNLAQREPSVWPRTLPHRIRPAHPVLEAPGVTSFGAGSTEDLVPVSLVPRPVVLRSDAREVALPIAWPDFAMASLTEEPTLPAPAADNFRYHRMAASRAKKDRRRPNSEISRKASADITGSVTERSGRDAKSDTAGKNGKTSKTGKGTNAAERPPAKGPSGHQMQIIRPAAGLTPRS